MYIGIDIGGTYTDAVLIDEVSVLKKNKFPTNHNDLLQSLLMALDQLLEGIDSSAIKRVVISTTLVTNFIVEDRYEPVAMVLIPGPGLNPADYPFKENIYILKGGIDYRGRQISALDDKQIDDTLQMILGTGISKVAVTGKFSCRNNIHEVEIGQRISQYNLEYQLGHKVSGKLNFLRRAATTMLTVAVRELHTNFVETVKQALEDRRIHSPVYILKADGGTLTLEDSKRSPVETIFSGPAASTLGALALAPEGETSVVVDIGGTTTDLALILDGKPLMASKGAAVGDYKTSINSFAVRSIPIGGDSAVVFEDGAIKVLPERLGPAYCLGGPVPTPTDALRVLGYINYGDKGLAVKGLEVLSRAIDKSTDETAKVVLEKVTQGIADAIDEMFSAWQEEPAYRIWELMQKRFMRPHNILGVGGAAEGIIPETAKILGAIPMIPTHSEVANAIGAAVAEPTLGASVRIDTEEEVYSVAEDGYQGKLRNKATFNEEEAMKLAGEQLLRISEGVGIPVRTGDIKLVSCEVFNMVRGFYTAGKIFDITVQTPSRILTRFNQGEGAGQ